MVLGDRRPLIMAEGFPIGREPRELKLGDSFLFNAASKYHTLKYDFKPASMDTTRSSTMKTSEGGEVTVNVPNIEGASQSQTVFKGSKTRAQDKECVLVVDNNTGEITLERLGNNFKLKKIRQQNSRPLLQPARPITPLDKEKKSPSRYNKQEQVENHHPPPRSMKPSHPHQSAGSMPLLGYDAAQPPQQDGSGLTDESFSSSSSDSEDSNSDREQSPAPPPPPQPQQRIHKPKPNNADGRNMAASMPQFLTDDLHLSESGSESN